MKYSINWPGAQNGEIKIFAHETVHHLSEKRIRPRIEGQKDAINTLRDAHRSNPYLRIRAHQRSQKC